jgi:hypothetical protein
VANAFPIDSASVVPSIVCAATKKPEEDKEEEMVDYELSLERMDVDVVYLSSEGYFVGDDARTQLKFKFATQSVVFEKPRDSINCLKPLHVKGHINGTLWSRTC